MADRKARGRFDTGPKGEKHPHAVLTEAKVRKICHLYFNKNHTLAELARHMGCSRDTILQIVRGRTWKHITKTHIPKGFTHKYERCKIRNEKMYKYFKEGYSYQEIAREFSMNIAYTREIIRNKMREHGDPPNTVAFRSTGRRKKNVWR